MNDILREYKKIQDRFDLPHFHELKDVFTIEIENTENLIEQIRKEMSEKILSLSERVIEPIIGGADSLSTLFEQNMLEERERERLFRIYKKIQVLKWENNLLSVKPQERGAAEWIKKTWDLWNRELSQELAQLCKKMASGWESTEFKNEKTAYHG